MKNASKKQGSAKPESGGFDGGSVGQIRDILFGEQMSHYEARFAELEVGLEKKFADLRASLEESVAELKQLVETEKSGINSRNVSREVLADQLSSIADAIRSANGA